MKVAILNNVLFNLNMRQSSTVSYSSSIRTVGYLPYSHKEKSFVDTGSSSRLLNAGKYRRYEAAFTLVELMVTIAIIAIVASIALPSFQNMLLSYKVSAETDALVSMMNYARNTALNKNISITVCPIGASSSATCGTNWATGLIVVDPAGPTLLQSKQFALSGPVASSAVTSVAFDPRGIATTQANFKVCDSRGAAFAKSMQVLPTGFVQAGSTLGQAIWSGGALTCP